MKISNIKINEIAESAIALAKKAFTTGEVPVAAIIFDDKGQIIAKAHNLIERKKDPTLHAEMLVIKEALYQTKQKFLDSMNIYITLEPCAMCLQALCFVRIKTIYFGAYDFKKGGISQSNILSTSMNNYSPEIYGGIVEEKCSQLMKEFFVNKRL
jgi:tRNA(adenine34) deaminase